MLIHVKLVQIKLGEVRLERVEKSVDYIYLLPNCQQSFSEEKPSKSISRFMKMLVGSNTITKISISCSIFPFIGSISFSF